MRVKPTKPEKCCGTCRWAKFEMTKHAKPRPNKNEAGKCYYVLPPMPPLPKSVTNIYGYQAIKDPAEGWIWFDLKDCPCWQSKEPEVRDCLYPNCILVRRPERSPDGR